MGNSRKEYQKRIDTFQYFLLQWLAWACLCMRLYVAKEQTDDDFIINLGLFDNCFYALYGIIS